MKLISFQVCNWILFDVCFLQKYRCDALLQADLGDRVAMINFDATDSFCLNAVLSYFWLFFLWNYLAPLFFEDTKISEYGPLIYLIYCIAMKVIIFSKILKLNQTYMQRKILSVGK